jgi:hypothetical protein
LAAAYADAVSASEDPALARRRNGAQILQCKLELDGLGLTACKMDTAEAAKRDVGHARNVGELQVELRDLIAFGRACISRLSER